MYNSIYYNSPEWVNQIMNLFNPATAYLNQLPQYGNAIISNPMMQGVSNYFSPSSSADSYNPQLAAAPASSGMTDAAYQQYIAYQQQIADRQYALAVAQMEQQKQAEERAYQLQLIQYQMQFPQLYNGISNFPIGDGIVSPSVPVSNTPVSTETLNLLKSLEPPHTIIFESATVGTVTSQGAQQGVVPDTFDIGAPNCHPLLGCSLFIVPTNGIGSGITSTVKWDGSGALWYCDGDTPISPIQTAVSGVKVQRRLVLKTYSSDPSEYKAAIETAVSSGSIPQTESAQATVLSGTDYHALGYQIGEAVKQLVPMLVEQYLEAKYGSV